jgi:hypothetical protein
MRLDTNLPHILSYFETLCTFQYNMEITDFLFRGILLNNVWSIIGKQAIRKKHQSHYLYITKTKLKYSVQAGFCKKSDVGIKTKMYFEHTKLSKHFYCPDIR